MTKHRRITGFVTVALLAVAATAAVMKSHAPWTDRVVVAGTVDASKLQAADFNERWSAMSEPGTEVR